MLYNNNVLKEIGWKMKRDGDMKHLVSLLFSPCCSLLRDARAKVGQGGQAKKGTPDGRHNGHSIT